MPPSEFLSKWWLKFGKEQGRITRTLSPYEVHPVKSLIASIPSKTLRKINENYAVLLPSALLFVGTLKWGVKANDEHHREHWD